MSLSDIIYEKINNDYSYGKYGDFNVIIMNSNSYINAAKLCIKYDKDFFDWKKNKVSKELIEEVENYIQSTENSRSIKIRSIIVVTTGIKILHGTYVHPLLIPHIASWISPKFAIKVSQIVNDRLTWQLRVKNLDQAEQIEKQNKQIQELIGYAKEAKTEISDVKVRLTVVETSLDIVEEEIIDTTDLLDNTIVELSVVQDKLDIAVEDRAVKPKTISKINQIGILSSKLDDNLLYVTCGQKSSVSKVIRLKNRSHNCEEIISNIPNAIYLFDHMKKIFGSKVNIVSRNVKLVTIDKKEFIDGIKSLFDGRRNIDLTKKP